MAGFADEFAGRGTQMNAMLNTGLKVLSNNQQITLTLYNRVVLPLDGFLFWVKADIMSASALLGLMPIDNVDMGQGTSVTVAAPTLTVNGSLHFDEDVEMEEGYTSVRSRVQLTTSTQVIDLTALGPNQMYVGETPYGQKYAFVNQDRFYEAAGLFHYVGHTIHPEIESQIIDDPSQLVTLPVVNNSLPFWLQLATTGLPIYPSYLSLPNSAPAYITVHVESSDTEALQHMPITTSDGSQYQLCSDEVRLTFYGVRAAAAFEFLRRVEQYTLSTENMGLMNSPVIQDDKEPQRDFRVLAMKKTAKVKVNYYQSVANAVALKFIEEVFYDFTES